MGKEFEVARNTCSGRLRFSVILFHFYDLQKTWEVFEMLLVKKKIKHHVDFRYLFRFGEGREQKHNSCDLEIWENLNVRRRMIKKSVKRRTRKYYMPIFKSQEINRPSIPRKCLGFMEKTCPCLVSIWSGKVDAYTWRRTFSWKTRPRTQIGETVDFWEKDSSSWTSITARGQLLYSSIHAAGISSSEEDMRWTSTGVGKRPHQSDEYKGDRKHILISSPRSVRGVILESRGKNIKTLLVGLES